MRILSCLLGLLLGAPALAQTSAVLNASPGPSDNGSAAGAALLFDLEARTGLAITGFSTASAAAAGSTYQVSVYTRVGTALGGPVNTGPGSSSDGWSPLGTFTVTQGDGEVSLPIALPAVAMAAGQTVGMAVVFPANLHARYLGQGSPAIQTFSNSALIMRSGDVRTVPFTTGGSFFSSRTLVGSITYRVAEPTLHANRGPANSSGDPDSGMFFNVQSDTGAVLRGLTTSAAAPVGTSFLIDVYTRQGTALGNVPGSGPATSPAGWAFRGSVSAFQGADQLTRPVVLPNITVPAGQTIGVALVYRGVRPRYFRADAGPLETYGTPTLRLTTGDALSIPFSTSSQVNSPRALVGSLIWQPTGIQLDAHPGPSNNDNDPGTGQFFNVTGPSDAVIRGFRVATWASPESTFQVQVYTRNGTALGGTSTTGPGSSSAGWTLHATSAATQASTGELSHPFIVPDIALTAGQIRGIALVITGAEPRYRSDPGGWRPTYSSNGMQIITGDARTMPFTTNGALFTGRQLVGSLYIQRQDALFSNGFQ